MGTNKNSAGGLQQNAYGGGKGLFYVGGIDPEFFDQISLRGGICDSILRFLWGGIYGMDCCPCIFFTYYFPFCYFILFNKICQYRRSLNTVCSCLVTSSSSPAYSHFLSSHIYWALSIIKTMGVMRCLISWISFAFMHCLQEEELFFYKT